MKILPWPPAKMNNQEIILGLDRMRNFLQELGNPQDRLPPIIHVAGTNGKGSVVSFIKYMLETQGYVVHRYISPHLVEFNERIEIARQYISDEYLLELSKYCEKISKARNLPVTFFEGTTAMAFLAFAKNKADALILEVGLGGREDATNVISKPEVSVITSLSLDHVDFLGDTVEKIAYEKAGIIKENCPVVVGKQEFPETIKVLTEEAKKKNAKIYIYGKDWAVEKQKDGTFVFKGYVKELQKLGEEIELPKLSLPGEHQYENAGAAIAALLVQNKLKITKESIIKGIQITKWPARMQNITSEKAIKQIFAHNKNAEIFLDGGHNEGAMEIIKRFIKDQNKLEKKKTIVLIGMLNTKNSKAAIRHLKDVVDFGVATGIHNNEHARSAEEIEQIFNELHIENDKTEFFVDGLKLIAEKFKNADIRVIICGSLYLAGEVLEFISKSK